MKTTLVFAFFLFAAPAFSGTGENCHRTICIGPDLYTGSPVSNPNLENGFCNWDRLVEKNSPKCAEAPKEPLPPYPH